METPLLLDRDRRDRLGHVIGVDVGI
jgi:hypothetical protein